MESRHRCIDHRHVTKASWGLPRGFRARCVYHYSNVLSSISDRVRKTCIVQWQVGMRGHKLLRRAGQNHGGAGLAWFPSMPQKISDVPWAKKLKSKATRNIKMLWKRFSNQPQETSGLLSIVVMENRQRFQKETSNIFSWSYQDDMYVWTNIFPSESSQDVLPLKVLNTIYLKRKPAVLICEANFQQVQ